MSGVRVEGSLLLLPHLATYWNVNRAEEISPHAFTLLKIHNPRPEMLILGTGANVQVRIFMCQVDKLMLTIASSTFIQMCVPTFAISVFVSTSTILKTHATSSTSSMMKAALLLQLSSQSKPILIQRKYIYLSLSTALFVQPS